MTPLELASAVILAGGLTTLPTDDVMLRTCSAVVAFVDGLPVVADAPPLAPWSPQVEAGAVLLAAKLYRRKDNPAGVIGIGDSAPVFVSRWDADIYRLLSLNAPTVG